MMRTGTSSAATKARRKLLRSTAVVSEVAYERQAIRYRVFEDVGEEVLRVTFPPSAVTADGGPLAPSATGPGWSYDASSGVVRVRRAGARTIFIAGATPVALRQD